MFFQACGGTVLQSFVALYKLWFKLLSKALIILYLNEGRNEDFLYTCDAIIIL